MVQDDRYGGDGGDGGYGGDEYREESTTTTYEDDRY